MWLLVTEIIHVVAYLCVGALVYFFWKKYFTIKNYILGFLFTFFIDVDHYIDMLMYDGFSLDIKRFISGEHFRESGKVYIFFHAWEYVLLVFVLFWVFRKSRIAGPLLFIFLGLGVHLIVDIITNNSTFLTYSLFYRILVDFRLDLLY